MLGSIAQLRIARNGTSFHEPSSSARVLMVHRKQPTLACSQTPSAIAFNTLDVWSCVTKISGFYVPMSGHRQFATHSQLPDSSRFPSTSSNANTNTNTKSNYNNSESLQQRDDYGGGGGGGSGSGNRLTQTLKEKMLQNAEARDARLRYQQRLEESSGPPVHYRYVPKPILQRISEHLWDHTPAEYFQIALTLLLILLAYVVYQLYRKQRAKLAHQPDSVVTDVGVFMTSPLIPVTDRVWMAESMLRTDIGGAPQLLKNNMYIIQMWDSGMDAHQIDSHVLLIYNPVKLTPRLKEEIKALGMPIRFIVVPVHDPFTQFAEYMHMSPYSKVFIPDGLRSLAISRYLSYLSLHEPTFFNSNRDWYETYARIHEVQGLGIPAGGPDKRWVDWFYVRGFSFDEIMLYHKTSKLLFTSHFGAQPIPNVQLPGPLLTSKELLSPEIMTASVQDKLRANLNFDWIAENWPFVGVAAAQADPVFPADIRHSIEDYEAFCPPGSSHKSSWLGQIASQLRQLIAPVKSKLLLGDPQPSLGSMPSGGVNPIITTESELSLAGSGSPSMSGLTSFFSTVFQPQPRRAPRYFPPGELRMEAENLRDAWRNHWKEIIASANPAVITPFWQETNGAEKARKMNIYLRTMYDEEYLKGLAMVQRGHIDPDLVGPTPDGNVDLYASGSTNGGKRYKPPKAYVVDPSQRVPLPPPVDLPYPPANPFSLYKDKSQRGKESEQQ